MFLYICNEWTKKYIPVSIIIIPDNLYISPLSLWLKYPAISPNINNAGSVPIPKKNAVSIPDSILPVPAADMNTVYERPHGKKPSNAPRG